MQTAEKRVVKPNIDVLLIQTGTYYDLSSCMFNTGLLSIAALLSEKGFMVKCLSSEHLADFSYQERMSYIRFLHPKIVGFTVNSDNITNVFIFAKELKAFLPDTIIVAGGTLAAITPEEIMNCPFIDFTVVGEGEMPFLQLCNSIIYQNDHIDKIPGLIYRQEDKLGINPRRPALKDLDVLPSPDYSLLGRSLGMPYSSGRGCPFSCSFCSQDPLNKGYRYFSPKRVSGDIIKGVLSTGVRLVTIVDDTFIAKPARVRTICELLEGEKKKRNLDFGIFCEGRADIFSSNDDLFASLKKAGVIRIQIGVESGVPEVLKFYNKNISLHQIEHCVDKCREQNIAVCGNLILGAPFENKKYFRTSLDFIKELIRKAPGLFTCQAPFLSPYPGTDIGDNLEKYGLVMQERDLLTASTTTEPVCRSEELSVFEIFSLKKIFEAEVFALMKEITLNLGFNIVDFHMMNKIKYGAGNTYLHFLEKYAPVVINYYTYKKFPYFRRFSEIKADIFLTFYPLILKKFIEMRKDGVVLKGFGEPFYTKNENILTVLENSDPQISIDQTAEKIAVIKGISKSESIENIILPVFQFLEERYLVVFYRAF